MRRLAIFCSYVLGLAFMASGFLKLMDPIGTGFIVEEYFKFMRLEFLGGASLVAGIAVSAAEFILGGMALVRYRMRFTSLAILTMMGLYLILTLFLAIFDPPMDCGCFGEAVHLTHLETLVKNIVLSLLCIPVFLRRGEIGYTCRKWHVAYRLAIVGVFAVIVPSLSLAYRPFIDFTDYKPSAVLSEGTVSEADYSSAMKFIYEKDGRRSSFTLDDLPDSTWAYVETVTEPLQPEGDDGVLLSLRDEDGQYLSGMFENEKIMLVSVYEPSDFDMDDWLRVRMFCNGAVESGMAVIVALAADEAQGAAVSGMLGYPVYYGDYKTLITLNRSNGGFTYVSNQSFPVVIEKWAYPMMDRISPSEISSEDPDMMLMNATVRRNSFMRIVALAYFVLVMV